MKNDKQHINPGSDKDFMQSLPEIERPFKKSKEDVWSELSDMMDEQETETPIRTIKPQETKVRSLKQIYWAAAAILVLMLSTSAFLRLYTTTVEAGAGQHLTALLPDGSSIELNASSTIKYHPYWWRFNRQVQFEGEGFFKVQKGKSFEVVSSRGKTIVLGTSFNIYSRKNDYKVTCYTGKVRVVSVISGKSADITPNQRAEVIANGSVISKNEELAEETISWMEDKFYFKGTPIQLVFEEIERQYGISIQTKEKLNYLYTGNFTITRQAEDVMKRVCKGLNLNYKKVNGGYLVSKDGLSE